MADASAWDALTSFRRTHAPLLILQSSFYGDFEKFDEDEEEDEDEDDDDDLEEDDPNETAATTLDGASLAEFRSKMDFLFQDDSSSASSAASAVDELIDYARSAGNKKNEEESSWATVATDLKEGVVLLANPAKFCINFPAGGGDVSASSGGFSTVSPSPALLAKFGLTLPPPAELGPDRRADLLPVLILVETTAKSSSPTMLPNPFSSIAKSNSNMRGVLLNRRTGYLLGDLEQPGSSGANSASSSSSSSSPPKPLLERFCIQPLWFGGVDNVASGLEMLHQCPAVIGSKMLTQDGLYWGGDPSQAQTAMDEETAEFTAGAAGQPQRVLTGFDFKFFVQSTVWAPGELEKQVDNQIWFLANVSKEVLFKPRDRMGTRRAKPLWTECMELLGGEYRQIRDYLYES